MTKQQLREVIRAIIKKELTESQPAIAPTKPTIKPTTPTPKPNKPRRLGNPSVKPKPKATMTEADMVAKIVKRFRTSKPIEETGKTWSEGYEEGYNKGYEDASRGIKNKFNNQSPPNITFPKFKDEYGNTDWRDTGEMGG